MLATSFSPCRRHFSRSGGESRTQLRGVAVCASYLSTLKQGPPQNCGYIRSLVKATIAARKVSRRKQGGNTNDPD